MPTMKEFTARYKVKANTIRRWTKTYAPYFSKGAKPPKGKKRRYNLDDADVIDLIATMREEDSEPGEILNALKAGKRGLWPRDANEEAQDTPGAQQGVMPRDSAMLAELSHKAGFLEGQLATMTEDRNYWRDKAESEREEKEELREQLKLLAAPKEDPAPGRPEEALTSEQDTALLLEEKHRAWWRFWD